MNNVKLVETIGRMFIAGALLTLAFLIFMAVVLVILFMNGFIDEAL